MDTLVLALIHEVFHEDESEACLGELLSEARARGAALALLPELPLDRWIPSSKRIRSQDAEPPGGRRHQILSRAAKEIGIGLVGGAIVREAETRRRFNTALVFDATGRLVATYRKAHIPEEEGFWETSHYRPGDRPPSVIDAFGFPVGLQICSDVNRPEGCQILAAAGAGAVFAPRATPLETYDRWKLVLRSNAVTGAVYVVSTNRPGPERGVGIGGPSVAIAPDGELLLETTDPVSVITLDGERVRQAREDYPGYLPFRSKIYARAWRAISRKRES